MESGEVEIKIVSGDITNVEADAMITAINSGGLWFGGIDGAIQKVAGNFYHNQAANEHLEDLKVVVAKGDHNNHKGKFDNVVFVVDDLMSELRSVIAAGLEGADGAGFKKVSIPAIRTGILLGAAEKSLEQVVNEWIMGIKRYLSRNKVKESVPGIREMTFVIYNNPELLEILQESLINDEWLRSKGKAVIKTLF